MDARSLFLFAAFALLAFIALASADRDFEEGDINFRVKGQSAKLFFGRKTKAGKKRDLAKEGFTVEVMHVKQKDNRGRDVGKPVRTLASQTFTVSPFNKNAMLQGIKTAHVDLMGYLKDPQANLTLSIYIFQEAGNVTFGNESSEVQKGTIKLFVKVENYTFCSGKANYSICKPNEVGEFLEVAIGMRNRKGKPVRKESDEEKKKRKGPRLPGDKIMRGIRCPEIDRLGRRAKCMKITSIGSDEVGVAEESIVDGVSKKMPQGYPKFDDIGDGNQRFTFRGPKFNATIVFDPVIDLDNEDDDDDDENDNHASSIQLNVFMFVAILAALFM